MSHQEPQEGTAPCSDHPAWTVHQSSLARRLGLSLPDLRKLRDKNAVEGVDWGRQKNRVLYSQAAAARLEALATASPPKSPPEEVPRAAPPQKTPLVVHRAGPQIRNRTLIEVTRPGVDGHRRRDQVMLMRVRNNVIFTPSTTIPPEDYEVRTPGKLFEFVGFRAPRR